MKRTPTSRRPILLRALLGAGVTAAIASCSGAPVAPSRASASAAPTAIATAAPRTPPPRGATDGAPELVLQQGLAVQAWTTYSPDGKLAFTALLNAFGVVDVDTGRVLGSFDRKCVGPTAFSADGRTVVFADCTNDGDGLHMWDLTTGEIHDLAFHSRAWKPSSTKPAAPSALVLDRPARGPMMIAYTRDRAWRIDTWTRAVVQLDVPEDNETQLAAVGEDGAIAIFGARALLSFATGATTPTRTDFGDALKLAAGDFDGGHGAAVLLFEDGRARIVSATAEPQVHEFVACPAEAAHRSKDVAFSDEGRHLIVACGGTLSERDVKLGTTREILSDPKRSFTIDVAGGKVVQHFGSTARVVDVATGAAGPAVPGRDYEVLADGARLGATDARLVLDSTTGDTVWAPDGDAASFDPVKAFHPRAALFTSGTAIDLRTLASFPAIDVDQSGGSVLSFEVVMTPTPHGVATVTDRDTGASWSATTEAGATLGLSYSGDYIIELATDWAKRSGTNVLLFHGARTPRRIEASYLPTVGPGGWIAAPCYVSGGDKGLRVYNLSSGAEWTFGEPGLIPPAFLGTDRLLIHQTVYDLSSGKVVWTLDREEYPWAADLGSDVVVVGPWGHEPSPLRVLEARTGAAVATIDDGGNALALRGRTVLLARGGRTLLWNAGVETPVPLAARYDYGPVRISDDGAFIWYQRKDGLIVAHRIADDRELWVGPGRSPMTNEGVFDPGQADHLGVLLRSGPNLIESRFTPVTELAERFGHPNLARDFFAGAPVSPVDAK